MSDPIVSPETEQAVSRILAVEMRRLHAMDYDTETLFASLSAMSDVRRANMIRRVRAWAAFPAGSADKNAMVFWLEREGLRPWQLSPERLEAVLARLA